MLAKVFKYQTRLQKKTGVSAMWADRLRNVRSIIEEKGYECLLLSPGPNLRYLTGFYFPFPGDFWDGLIAWDPVGIIPLDEEPILVVKKDYEDWTKAISQIDNIRYYSNAKNRMEILKDLIGKVRGTLGIEDHLPSKIYEQLVTAFPGIKIKNASRMLSEVRMIKSKEEIEVIRKAVGMVEKGIEAGREIIQESITEIEISSEIEQTMRKLGAETIPFCVVQSGAMPGNEYFSPSTNRVKKGDFILMDIAAAYKGYHADITRMTLVGKPSKRQKEVYEVVLDAQLKALDAIRNGVKVNVIYDAARRVMDEGGYSKYARTGIGHGLGLEVHEVPFVSESRDTEMVLQAGMVITIEPGVGLPGEFGIAIEDDVLVTAGGKEILSALGKELVQI